MPIQLPEVNDNNNNNDVENSIIVKESSSLLSNTMSNLTIYNDDDAVVKETPTITEELLKDNNSIIKPKKRIIIRRKQSQKQSTQGSGDQQNHDTKIINMELYNELMKSLPIAYDFELLKTIKRCNELYTKNIALQMPEGLLMYSCIISDILIQLVSTTSIQSITILSDVTYGACCIDDINATLLNCDLLIHYGHSCLIPIQHTNNTNTISILYVFVEIQINEQHVIDCFIVSMNEYIKNQKKNKNGSSHNDNNDIYYIYLLGTIQFRHALITIQQKLQFNGYHNVIIPQSKPLSPGEVLGCTSPHLVVPKSSDDNNSSVKVHSVCYFIADGRFHMESTMIGNPHIDLYYRYNPYTRTITIERYGTFVKSVYGSLLF